MKKNKTTRLRPSQGAPLFDRWGNALRVEGVAIRGVPLERDYGCGKCGYHVCACSILRDEDIVPPRPGELKRGFKHAHPRSPIVGQMAYYGEDPVPYRIVGLKGTDRVELLRHGMGDPIIARFEHVDRFDQVRVRQVNQTENIIEVAGLPIGSVVEYRTARENGRYVVVGFDPDGDPIVVSLDDFSSGDLDSEDMWFHHQAVPIFRTGGTHRLYATGPGYEEGWSAMFV